MSHLSDTPNDGQQGNPPHEPLYDLGPCCNEPVTYYADDGTPVHWIGEFLGSDEDDPTGLTALRDMLDACGIQLESEGTPMTQLYASSLAAELDQMGVGL